MPRFSADLGPRLDPDDPPIVVLGVEEFTCLAEAPVGALLWLARSKSATEAVVEFVAACLADDSDDERERLLTALSSREHVVSRSALESVFDDLVEHYSGRPTTPPTALPGGRSAPGTTSTDSSPSAVRSA